MTPKSPPRANFVLGIILATYLMIILDVSVVITALPNVREDLGFSDAALSWVQNAYALTFGGLLLLGARAGDLLGRRRVFVAGIALFTGASMLGGLAQSPTWLLAARALQGVGAAIAAPSTLALLTVSFPEGRERTRAVAYYSAVAGAGGSVGLVLGGMLTTWASWRWGLFINVPIGLALIWLAPRHLPETERQEGRFDFTGAATSTLGMTALVYGLVRAADVSWGDPLALVSFVAAATLLSLFIANERRAEHPITPLHLFSSRTRSGAYGARMLAVGAMFGMFFFLTQFMQGAEGYSALTAGLAFLPMTLSLFATVQAIPRISSEIGDSRLLAGGLLLALIGMTWLSRVSVGGDYFTQIALTTAGITGVADKDAGAASGLVNTAHQLGGTLGIGILISVFTAAGNGGASQLAEGVPAALTASAVLIALALVVVVTVMRPQGEAVGVAEPEAAA